MSMSIIWCLISRCQDALSVVTHGVPGTYQFRLSEPRPVFPGGFGAETVMAGRLVEWRQFLALPGTESKGLAACHDSKRIATLTASSTGPREGGSVSGVHFLRVDRLP